MCLCVYAIRFHVHFSWIRFHRWNTSIDQLTLDCLQIDTLWSFCMCCWPFIEPNGSNPNKSDFMIHQFEYHGKLSVNCPKQLRIFCIRKLNQHYEFVRCAAKIFTTGQNRERESDNSLNERMIRYQFRAYHFETPGTEELGKMRLFDWCKTLKRLCYAMPPRKKNTSKYSIMYIYSPHEKWNNM